MSPSLIGRLGSSTFRPSTTASVDVRHGLALLSGIGTRALPSWDSRIRWNNLMGGPTCELTSSIVPRGTSFHRVVELEFPPIGFDPARVSCCCRDLFPGPAELGASTHMRCR